MRLAIERLHVAEACVCVLLLMPTAQAASNAGNLSASGYFKSFFVLSQPAPVGRIGDGTVGRRATWLSTNRLRLNLAYRLTNSLDVDSAYDFVPRIQSAALLESQILFREIDPFIYRVADLDPHLYPAEGEATRHFVTVQNLDRAMVTFHMPRADLTVGRQAIAWGSARAINPTDVLAPFTFETLDTEDRIGIDAVRMRIPVGVLSEIDAGYVFGRHLEFENSAFYGRTKFNIGRTDTSLLVMGFRENLLAGFDLARSIRGAGFWLEAAYIFVDAFSGYDTGRRHNYFRASSGMDYSFTGKTYGFFEYHFNGAGNSHPSDYLSGLSRSAYVEGSVYLMGRHYFIPGISYQVSPLITLTGQSLINATDPSVLIAPQIEYNITANSYVGGGAFIGIGKRPVAGLAGPLILRSEFGGYPGIYFGSFRYYF